ncbi:hypothetical protein Pcinc_043412 [Petrolisthes cinctipes]|uniref:Uncharacterized protein n=1 Tax=Petrolisthes cinctipes TaxID=88211 RepID=A0AAE1BFN8_PETCI|nr:hypothetical protein Pcinc_043412 [Petrolisthes cinctipes]
MHPSPRLIHTTTSSYSSTPLPAPIHTTTSSYSSTPPPPHPHIHPPTLPHLSPPHPHHHLLLLIHTTTTSYPASYLLVSLLTLPFPHSLTHLLLPFATPHAPLRPHVHSLPAALHRVCKQRNDAIFEEGPGQGKIAASCSDSLIEIHRWGTMPRSTNYCRGN